MEVNKQQKYKKLASLLALVFLSCCSNPIEEIGNEIESENTEPEKALVGLNIIVTNGSNNSLYTYTFEYDVDSVLLRATLESEAIGYTTYYALQELNSNKYVLSTRNESSYLHFWVLERIDNSLYILTGTPGLFEGEFKFVFNEGQIDSIIEPVQILAFAGSLQYIQHTFEYHNGNCISYANSTYRDGALVRIDTIRYSFTEIGEISNIPNQIPYNLVFSEHNIGFPLDPLFMFSLAGIDVLPSNCNLIESRDGDYYYYNFNTDNCIDRIEFTNSNYEFDFLFTLEYD